MTQCNRCLINGLKRRCSPEQTVTVIGSDVYRHPLTVDVAALTKEQREPHWVAWVAVLTAECAC